MNPLERISKWFTYGECTRSTTATRQGMDNTPNEEQLACLEALCKNFLDKVRDVCKRSISPFSMFRCFKLNVLVGGSKNSQHMTGEAVDFLPTGLTVMQTMKIILQNNIEFDQLIDEFGSWVHASYTTKRKNRNQILQYRKVNGNTVVTTLTREQVLSAA